MGLTSHIFCFYDAFYFYHVYSYLMTSLMMVSLMKILKMLVLGPGYLVHALFYFPKTPLVVSVDYLTSAIYPETASRPINHQKTR